MAWHWLVSCRNTV